MSTPNNTAAIIGRLKLDTTDFKAGYAQAKSIQASAQAEALALSAQQTRLRGQLESQYSSMFQAESQKRIASLQSELKAAIDAAQGKSAADKQALAESAAAIRDQLSAQQAQVQAYVALKAQLQGITSAVREQRAAYQEASAAAVSLQAQGKASGQIVNPLTGIEMTLSRLLPGFAGLQGQFSGITSSLIVLSQGFKGVASDGAKAAEGLGAMEGGGAEAGAEVDALSVGFAGLATQVTVGVAAVAAMGFGLVKVAISAGAAAEQIKFMSEKTGIAVHDLQEFEAVGKITDLTLTDLVTAQRRLSVAITGQAQVGPDGELIPGGAGAGRGPAVLAALEIPTKDVAGNFRDVKSILMDVADVFSKLPDGALKSRMAIDLLGRSGLNLIPILNLGRDGYAQLTEVLDKSMPDITKAGELWHDYQVQAEVFSQVVSKLKVAIAELVLPGVITFLTSLNELLSKPSTPGTLMALLLGGPSNAFAYVVSGAAADAGAKQRASTQVSQGIKGIVAAQSGSGAAPLDLSKVDAALVPVARDEQMRQSISGIVGGTVSGEAPLDLRAVDAAQAVIDRKAAAAAKVYEGTEKQNEAEQKLFTIAQAIAKLDEDTDDRNAKLLGTQAQLANAKRDELKNEEEMNAALEVRAQIYARMGFASADQAKAVLAKVAESPTSAAPGIFGAAGVPYPDERTTQGKKNLQDLSDNDAVLARTSANLYKNRDLEASITEELAKQGTEIADLDQKRSELLEKLNQEVNLQNQLSSTQKALADNTSRQAELMQTLAIQKSGYAIDPDIKGGQAILETEKEMNAAIEEGTRLKAEHLRLTGEVLKAPVDNFSGQVEEIRANLENRTITPDPAVSQYQGVSAALRSYKDLLNVQEEIQSESGDDVGYKQTLGVVKEIESVLTNIAKLTKAAADEPIVDLVARANLTAGSLSAGIIKPDEAVSQYEQTIAHLQQIKNQNLAIVHDPSVSQLSQAWVDAQTAIVSADSAIKKLGEDLKAALAMTPMATFAASLEALGHAFDGFGGGLGKQISNIGGGIRNTMASLAQLQALGDRVYAQQEQDYLNNPDADSPVPRSGNALGAGIGQLFIKNATITDRLTAATAVVGTFGASINNLGGQQGVAGLFSGGFSGFEGGGAIGKGIGSEFSNGAGGTMASLGSTIGGIAGAAIGIVTGIIGLFKHQKQVQAQAEIDAIKQQVVTINENLQQNVIDIKTAITELQAASAQAAAETNNGKTSKGGNATQMASLQQQIGQQISQLKAQQQQILQNFSQQLATFKVPVGVQQYAATLEQIADTLTKAAGAGASATDQMNFLNASLQQLTTTVGTDLLNAEQQTFSLMLQSINLTQQRSQLLQNEAQQVQGILSGLGLAPQLTPAQQAAQQIAAIRQSTQQQLDAIDEQQNMLQAQLNGQMQLYGWTQQDLAAQNAKAEVLQIQLDLQEQLTAQTVAGITAQQAWYNELLQGIVPLLPPGAYPNLPTSVPLPSTFTPAAPPVGPVYAAPNSPATSTSTLPPSSSTLPLSAMPSGPTAPIQIVTQPTPVAPPPSIPNLSNLSNHEFEQVLAKLNSSIPQEVLAAMESIKNSSSGPLSIFGSAQQREAALSASLAAKYPSIPVAQLLASALPTAPANGAVTVNVTVTNPSASAQDIANAVTDALNKINIARAQGLQP